VKHRETWLFSRPCHAGTGGGGFWHKLSFFVGMGDLTKKHVKEENRVQAEAFRRMNGNELELIGVYAEDFRDIISEFEARFGRVPTADDLLWVESQRQGHDITE